MKYGEKSYLCIMSERDYIQSFSDYLFWDVDKESIDLEENASYVVSRVLERGQLSDWNLLVQRYGIPRITLIAQKLRSLEPRALSFICAISSMPKQTFRCYTMKQSTQALWNF